MSVEEKYSKALEAITKAMMRDAEKRILSLYETEEAKKYFLTFDASAIAMDASIASMARKLMRELEKKYSKLFGSISTELAERMVTQASKESATSLHKSMEKISGGLSLKAKIFNTDIKETFKASISENVSLIKSIPSQYLDNVSGAVYRSISSGNGIADLKPYLEKQFGITERRAKNIALDQTRKAYTSINADRMRAVKMNKFEWVHSGGGLKPRDFHIDEYPTGLNGGIFDIDNPPIIDPKTGERGLPGQLPNCGCTMRPVLEFGND